MYNLKLIMCYTATFTILIDSENSLEEEYYLEKEILEAFFMTTARAIHGIFV